MPKISTERISPTMSMGRPTRCSVAMVITKEKVSGASAMAATRRSRKKSNTDPATKQTTTTNMRRKDWARKLASVAEKLAPSNTNSPACCASAANAAGW